ncbi:uncharacterized protein [Panulirus ornatus]|uniref:uncharacterized protein n=1 Tax=Panulirus ornatus TaxID=150431 RepID=UPI003A88D543
MFTVSRCVNGRMQFTCMACNKNMNCKFAVSQHELSGAHQKKVDRMCQERIIRDPQFLEKYKTNSLQFKLATSNVGAVGLQLVEEFRETEGSDPYFKCNLCGSHGTLNSMYYHLIGPKHTERYIKIRIKQESPFMTPLKREELRRVVIENEGQRLEEIKKIIGKEYFPGDWIRHKVKENKNLEGQRKQIWKEEKNQDQPGEGGPNGEELDTASRNNEKKAALQDDATNSQSISQKELERNQVETNKMFVKNLLTKLRKTIDTPDHTANTVTTPKDALFNLQIMYQLTLTLNEVNIYAIENTVDVGEQMKLNQNKKSLNKVVRYIKKQLLPSLEAELPEVLQKK